MSNVCRMIVPSILLVGFVAGCCCDCGSVTGRWILCENQPSMDRDDYKIMKASFYENGSYEALISQGDQTLKTKGTYDYNGCSHDLFLMSGDEVKCYKARRVSDKKLHLDTCSPEGIPTTAVLVRYWKCPYNPPCNPAPQPCYSCP